MYKVEAIIRPHLIEDVRQALKDLGIETFTTQECRGTGIEIPHTYRGSSYSLNLAPRMLVMVVVQSGQLDEVVDALQKSACTEETGDGKIFVTKVEQVVRIRTNERGETAL